LTTKPLNQVSWGALCSYHMMLPWQETLTWAMVRVWSTAQLNLPVDVFGCFVTRVLGHWHIEYFGTVFAWRQAFLHRTRWRMLFYWRVVFHHYATSGRASFFCIEVVAYLKRFTGRVSGASIWILLSSRFYRNNSVYIPHGAGAHDRSTSLVEDYFCEYISKVLD
jgi:hypothetical protein